MTRDGGSTSLRPSGLVRRADRSGNRASLARLARALARRGVALLPLRPARLRRFGRQLGGERALHPHRRRTRRHRRPARPGRARPAAVRDPRPRRGGAGGDGSVIGDPVALRPHARGTAGALVPRPAAPRRRRALGRARGAARHPFVDAIDRAAEELIERADRHEATMALPARRWRGDAAARRLARAVRHARCGARHDGASQHDDRPRQRRRRGSIPTSPSSSRPARRQAGNAPSRQVVAGADHDLAAADDATIALIADDLAGRLVPRDLPPVLIALEADRPNG